MRVETSDMDVATASATMTNGVAEKVAVKHARPAPKPTAEASSHPHGTAAAPKLS